MTESTGSFSETLELEDDAEYSWWRDSHPEGFVLAVRARHAPVLHRARCPEVDRDRHGKRLKAKGARQICSNTKSALRTWHAREVPDHAGLIERCIKCGP